MNINHAILHVFDFEGGTTSFSQRELDLSVRTTKSYVQRQLRKITASAESKHGAFEEESPFAAELERYLAGGDFIDFSAQIAEFLYNELRTCADAEACDLLVADYEADPQASAATVSATSENADDEGDPQAAELAARSAADAAYEGRGERCFALILLPRKQSFMHDILTEGGAQVNDIVRHNATLPTPAQKLDSYAVIEAGSLRVDFNDKPRDLMGESCMLIPERLLCCSAGASSKEVIQTVTRIVADVAQEYGSNSAQAVSKAKAIMQEKSAESEYLPPWELGAEVFEDEPQMRERFEEVAREEELPERVSVKRSVATRMAKSHRIRTDTGIEITFPSEYSTSTEFIEFVTERDGSMSIELKNIGSIENR